MWSEQRPFLCRNDATMYAIVAGGAMAAAWLLFADGIVLHVHFGVEPVLKIMHWLPGLGAMVAFGFMLCVPGKLFVGEHSVYERVGACTVDGALFCVFITFVVTFTSTAAAFLLYDAMTAESDSAYAFIAPSTLDHHLNISVPNVTATDTRNEAIHAYSGAAMIVQTLLVGASTMACLRARIASVE